MDVTIRGLCTADIPAWDRLLAAIEEVDRTGEHYSEDDLAEEMANPEIELGKDIVGAFDGDEMVGYYTVYARSAAGEVHKIHLDGGVRPDRRGQGLGARLATAMRARALEAHQEGHPEVPALLTLRGLSDNAEQAALMEHLGLEPERWSFTMRADLSRDLPAPATVPEGLVLRRYDDSLSDAVLDAHNAAFTDHPNFTPWSATMWRQWVTGSRTFRPDVSFVVVDPSRPEEVVAYVQSSEFEAQQQLTGRREAYVGKVGTRREYRGNGLASILLAHTLHEYRGAGYDDAALDVDSANPTGALGIYERAGFEIVTRFTDYAERVTTGQSTHV